MEQKKVEEAFQEHGSVIINDKLVKIFKYLEEDLPRAFVRLTNKAQALKKELDTMNFKINNQLMIVFASRGPGQFFGELALRTGESCKRAATIRTVKDSIFAVIDKKNYQNCLERIENKKNEESVNYYKRIPFMKPLSKKVLSDCRLFMEPAKYEMN